MTNIIKRWECPECGAKRDEPWEHSTSWLTCPGVPVEREYVAVELGKAMADGILAVRMRGDRSSWDEAEIARSKFLVAIKKS